MESLVAEKNLEFLLHVIPPPMRLNWSTPRSLFISTFLNHIRGDKAPIGHLYVEFPLLNGDQVITGMSRNKMDVIDSIKLVQGKKLGLGTFFYDFDGKLDSVKDARDEIIWAKNKNRHASIRVSISEEKAQKMQDFLNQWITRGSFHHYSGGLRVAIGEGSGCAEFGMHFLGMALGLHATHPEWMRSVLVPDSLIGGGFAEHAARISVLSILKNGNRWAHQDESHHVYATPDPELIFDWIQSHTAELTPEKVTWSSGKFVQEEFKVSYPQEPLNSAQEQWAKVIEKVLEK